MAEKLNDQITNEVEERNEFYDDCLHGAHCNFSNGREEQDITIMRDSNTGEHPIDDTPSIQVIEDENGPDANEITH